MEQGDGMTIIRSPEVLHKRRLPDGASVEVSLRPEYIPTVASPQQQEVRDEPMELPRPSSVETANPLPISHAAPLPEPDATSAPATEIETAKRAAHEAGYAEGLAQGFEQGFQNGDEKGRAEGYEAGSVKGHLEATAAQAERIVRFERLIADLEKERSHYLQSMEEEVVEALFTTVCKIVGDTYATSDGMTQILKHSFQQVRERNHAKIILHPDDLAALQAGGHETQLSAMGTGITLEADETLIGGCRIAGINGDLDARLETQIDVLKNTLLSVRHSRMMGKDE